MAPWFTLLLEKLHCLISTEDDQEKRTAPLEQQYVLFTNEFLSTVAFVM
jgi:hypothetical protein